MTKPAAVTSVWPALRVLALSVTIIGALAQPASAFFCFNFSFGSGPRHSWGPAGPGYASWPGQPAMSGPPFAAGPYGNAGYAPWYPARQPWAQGWAGAPGPAAPPWQTLPPQTVPPSIPSWHPYQPSWGPPR